MPIYEYHCRACGHEFEEMQKITEGPVRKCPKCAARKVERLVSRSSFQLKGGGWYVTEYGGKSASGDGSASGKGKATGSTSDKPAAKSSKAKDTSKASAKSSTGTD